MNFGIDCLQTPFEIGLFASLVIVNFVGIFCIIRAVMQAAKESKNENR